jgi:hypothetical protein
MSGALWPEKAHGLHSLGLFALLITHHFSLITTIRYHCR